MSRKTSRDEQVNSGSGRGGDDGGATGSDNRSGVLFTARTKAIVWGMQQRAVQGMLDFDYSCSRPASSYLSITGLR